MQSRETISCIIIDDESIAREIIETHLSKINNIHVVASCSHAMEAFNVISQSKIDLVFLDINMPDISGISFAKSINKDIRIIFTTAYRDYAVEGFELQAVDYLIKPISYERLLKAVNVYFNVYSDLEEDTLESLPSDQYMFVRSDRRMIKVDFDAVFYIESYGDYIKIHLADKIILTRETIGAVETKLPELSFIRIHRSFIAAVAHISSYTHERISVKNTTLPISRSYRKKVLKLLSK